MKIEFSQVCRDYLALRGESPDLLPLLEEDEEAPVLLLSRELRARLPAAAVKATLEVPAVFHDEIRCTEQTPRTDKAGCGLLRMASDYLRLYSVSLADWKEPVRAPEPENSLRRSLGANLPRWMICRERPMVLEERDSEGIVLKVYGSDAFDLPAVVYYIPFPEFDGETLTISRAAYHRMLQILTDPVK